MYDALFRLTYLSLLIGTKTHIFDTFYLLRLMWERQSDIRVFAYCADSNSFQ